MKWLIVLGVLVVVAIFIAARFRHQIRMAIYVFRMFRKMRAMGRAESNENQIETNAKSDDVQLVRCAKCGSWTPQGNALKLGKGTFYCSADCMETAVEVNR